MQSAANLWHYGGEDMFYLLGVLIIASGSILLLGLASRHPQRPHGPQPDRNRKL
jgi:hypothetical protein